MRRDQRANAAHDAMVSSTDPVQLELDRRSCNEKVRFASKTEANAKRKKTKRLSASGTASVYPCAVCRGWHITTWSREDQRRYRR